MFPNHVWCTTTFSGFHRWKDASGKVNYLKSTHRHLFHVKAAKAITGLNRESEFITLKEQITSFLRNTYENKEFEHSCEMIAADLISMFNLLYCTVSEDGENGATIFAPIDPLE